MARNSAHHPTLGFDLTGHHHWGDLVVPLPLKSLPSNAQLGVKTIWTSAAETDLY